MTESKRVTVTLGELQDLAEARVRSGAYASISEVLRAGLLALDREEQDLDHRWREQVQRSLADPRPSIPSENVFAELRAYHLERSAADKRDL